MPETITTEETTNAVLKESIQGLVKLTDERFNNLKDTLVRMEQANIITIAAFNKRTEEQDVKIESNRKSIETLNQEKSKLEGSVTTLKILGGLIAFITPILTAVVTHYWK